MTKDDESQPVIRGDSLDVLDHGFVRLIDWMGNDLSIVRSARVSYAAEWRAAEDEGKDAKLIGYLLRNSHTSPFESVEFQFEIKCPMFVARQWHRHRTWSYNEVSARYTELPAEFYVPALNQITSNLGAGQNKQQRSEEQHPRADDWQTMMYSQNRVAFDLYESMLKDGVPRELARTILPLATYTRFFAKVDLHNLLHFLKLRLHEHAQYEIRVYAEAILNLVTPIVPVTLEAAVGNRVI